MLAPNKHSHPDETVIAAATVLLQELRGHRIVAYDELKSTLTSRSTAAEYLFTPALSFLYLVGLVEYRPTIDSFEYVGM
jgi:hypothetical protein